MKKNINKVISMVIAALLCAIGILIPMYFPGIKLPPASYTLASHVPIFIAMFISPPIAISVALVTTFGFFIAGFPLIIVFRALSHLIFAALGALYLKKNGKTLLSIKSTVLFAIIISMIHAVCEVIVVTWLWWGGSLTEAFHAKGYLVTVIGLVGVGTLIHSLIDFTIAVTIWKSLQHVLTIPANAKIKAK